jgi:carbohydrate-binding DOMON domain-containing protein
MRTHRLVRALSFATLAGLACAAAAIAAEPPVVLQDPAGDDDGPGSYAYPNNEVYKRGSFDLRKVEIIDKESTVEFRVTLGAAIEDPWDSKSWDGNGFSLQFVQIYIDIDHQKGSGYTGVLPGLGTAKFADDEAWDKVVLLSPQGRTRLSAEVRGKAGNMRGGVVMPSTTRASGKTLVASVKKSELGTPSKTWGYQVVVQSNEGFPDKGDLLTRKVNETKGDHRFGGGSDYDCDPQVLDILAGQAKGEKSEAADQHKTLAWSCAGEKPGKVAHLPMIYAAPAAP